MDNESIPALTLEELAKIHNMTIIEKPIGAPIIERYLDELSKQIQTKEKRERKGKNMKIDTIGPKFTVWYNGEQKLAAIRRERDNKGRFQRFTIENEHPAILVDSREFGVIRQDEQAKLYFVTN